MYKQHTFLLHNLGELPIVIFHTGILSGAQRKNYKRGPGRGIPVSHIPLIILKKGNIPKINMANIPKIQRALYPHIPKFDPSIPYPVKFLQKYPVSL